MCGRYTQTLSADDLAAAMSAADETGGQLRVSYNVAPTTAMPIVVTGQPEAVSHPGRSLRLATWGLVPSWARDRAIGSRLINARAETVASKPAFRAAFAARRCLVPATGFYEWHRVGGARRGQPYYIHPAGHPGADGLFAFAGLYEVWRHGDQPLTTFTVVTTGAAAGLEFLHDRSPVVVPRSAWARWLDPAVRGPGAHEAVLRPAPAGVFAAHPVAAAVGNVRNDSPHLIDPVELDGTHPSAPAETGSGTAADRIPLHQGTLLDQDEEARSHASR